MGKSASPSVKLFHYAELSFRIKHCDPNQLGEKGNRLRNDWLLQNEGKLPAYFGLQLLLTDEIWFNLGENRNRDNLDNSLTAFKVLNSLVSIQNELIAQTTAPMAFQSKFENLLQQFDKTGLPAGLHRRIIETTNALNNLADTIDSQTDISCDSVKHINQEAEKYQIWTELELLLITDEDLLHGLTSLFANTPSKIKAHQFIQYFTTNKPNSLRPEFNQSIQRHQAALAQAQTRCQ